MHAGFNYLILSGLLVVVTSAAAAGQVVYKWKDSAGAVHYSDTPPPAGAVVLKGPKIAPVPDAKPLTEVLPEDNSILHAPCRPDISAVECEAARRTMQADVEDLARTSQDARKDDGREVSNQDLHRRQAILRAKECSEMRNMLVHLEDRQSGKSTEILTADERTSVPLQIAEVEAAIVRSCD